MQDHIVRILAPDENYTRHSEGAFLRLNDGRIVFIHSRFTAHVGDDAPSDIVRSYSSDEGETWTEPEVVIPASMYGVKNVMSVSLLRMQSGELGLFYGVKVTPGSGKHMLSLSRDEGQTFYRHIQCSLPDRIGYYVLNNDRVERLKSGRILMPLIVHRCSGYDSRTAAMAAHNDGRNAVCHHPGAFGGTSAAGYWDSRGVAVFLYSDDDGETWQEADDTVSAAFTGTHTALQETGVIEKKNGALWAYCRTDKMVQYEFFSFDGGMHWTRPQPSRFTSPDSPLKIKRHPETGDLYAVWNPIPNYLGRKVVPVGWDRTPMVWAVSHDDGVTWSENHVIDDEPDHGYSYPAIFFTNDGAMLVAHCSGGPEDKSGLARLTIHKLAI